MGVLEAPTATEDRTVWWKIVHDAANSRRTLEDGWKTRQDKCNWWLGLVVSGILYMSLLADHRPGRLVAVAASCTISPR